MTYNYKLENFVATPSDDDLKIQLWNRYGKIKHLLDPDIEYYYYQDRNVIIIVDDHDDIILDFIDYPTAVEALKKLSFVISIFKSRASTTNWYTQAELNNGVLNFLYYTQTDVDYMFTNLTLSGLSDTIIQAPVSGESLVYENGYWINKYVAGSGTGGTCLIGPDEAGYSAYTEGVFDDFIDTTRVGIPVDRFNRLFLALVPPNAPYLRSWNSYVSGDENVKLSFDNTHQIANYYNANDPTDHGAPGIALNGTWGINYPLRLGAVVDSFSNLTGELNYNITQNTSTPYPAYQAKTFGNADQGNLLLYVNGVLTSTLDLTTTSASTSSTAGNTVSGFNVSEQSASLFPQGSEFTQFYNRSGNWLVRNSDANIRYGYNYIFTQHVYGSSTKTLDRIEFIVDHDTTATIFSNITYNNLSMLGSKKLSGIDFDTSGQADYGIRIDNLYRNTYSNAVNALTFFGNNVSSQSHGLPIIVTDYTTNLVYSKTMSISSSLLLNESITARCTAIRPLGRTSTSPSSSINGILMDAHGLTSTATIETFFSEEYRLKSGSNYNSISEISSGNWDSNQSLDDGSVGHTVGMQVIGGSLIYPGNNGSFPSDFRTSNIINGPPFNNGGTGGGARDYTNLTGVRQYIRYFYKNPSTNHKKFRFTISGNGNVVNVGSNLAGTSNITVEIKSPVVIDAWLDACKPFVTNSFQDGDGCLYANLYPGCTIGSPWELTWGSRGTYDTSGYLIMKITIGNLYSGSFSGINFEFI